MLLADMTTGECVIACVGIICATIIYRNVAEVCVWTDRFETTEDEHAYIPDDV